MRSWMAWLVTLLTLGVGGFAALSLGHGQERDGARPADTPRTPATLVSSPRPAATTPGRDLTKLTPLQQQMYLSAQRGADWLRRANRSDGRFVYGYAPALKTSLEGDHYLRQIGAAFALARAARFLGDERYLAVARQAVLTLLLDTATDPQDPQVRHTALPTAVVNRLAAAGLLVMAINELPAPGDDILAQSEGLCNFLRQQQQPDGSFRTTDAGDAQAAADPEAINQYAGEALYGLLLSQRYRPAPWKTDAARRALAYYRTWWRAHKSMAMIPWQTAASAEAFALTREQPFADFVFEMNDWLCERQHVQLDPRHPLWIGGFPEWAEGRPTTVAPQAGSAAYAESLAEACRVTRLTGDAARYPRYREALERCLQFLTTLQYTEANTQHFADWYRPVLLGGFHASHEDGNLRIDYAQHALAALVQYLSYVTD